MQCKSCGKVVMQCKWCGKVVAKLVKSHIIPKAFDKDCNRILYANKHTKRIPGGEYDYIVCRVCEHGYRDIDSRAVTILLHDFKKIGTSLPSGMQLDEKYIQDIKRFLIYTLWKASVCKLEVFKNVSLGPYEDRIKNDIISNKTFSPDEYSFVARYSSDTPLYCPGKPEPFYFSRYTTHLYKLDMKRSLGCDYYCVELENLEFWVKVDDRKTPWPNSILADFPRLLFYKDESIFEDRAKRCVRIKTEQLEFLKNFNKGKKQK